jgi:uncharacterized membrane protein YtjA (UPF0391 family)
MYYWSALFLLITAAAAAAGLTGVGGSDATIAVWMLCVVSLILTVMSTLLTHQR